LFLFLTDLVRLSQIQNNKPTFWGNNYEILLTRKTLMDSTIGHYHILIIVIACLTFNQSKTASVLAQQAIPPAGKIVALNSDHPTAIAEVDRSSSNATPLVAPSVPTAPALRPSANNTHMIPPVKSSVEVNAAQQTLEGGQAVQYHVTRDEVLSSAGTWGDFTRFLQLLPGVVWNTDMSNDVMVRGGNPSENLYVLDGIEVPNINHIAVEGTTGGFTSMIDTSIISSVEMEAGAYDARYSSRLSSLIEVQTRKGLRADDTKELEIGISGAGGFVQRSIGNNANLLLSAHRSVLNLVTDDIGLNGVPIYTNGLARLEWALGSKDHVSALSLNGADSINITPAACDQGVTQRVQTQYGGGRSTDGLVWQHIHRPAAVSTLTASYSWQSQDIEQQWDLTTYENTPTCFTPLFKLQTMPFYQELTRDGIGTLSYGMQLERRNWLFSMGASGRAVGVNYAVAQPSGQQSPFSVDPTWTDADTFSRKFTTGQLGAYMEAAGRLGTRWSVNVGAREEIFALTAAHMFDPRASLAFHIGEHRTLNATYTRSSQLAPTINILSYANNARLRPLQVEKYSVGADLWQSGGATVGLATYYKHYSNEPVSTEHPSLMLANMVDTLGQQFVWLPLKSGGHGRTEGVELLLRAQVASRFRLLGSASYSRTLYVASDGVLRSGNFDFPLTGNGLAIVRLPGRFEIALRDSYASGRPYTPFNVSLSEQQSRGVYDLTQVNALRGPAYNRVDIDFNRDIRIHHGQLNIHVGAENALRRNNFLGYVWMDGCEPSAGAKFCGYNPLAVPGIPVGRIMQMPLFPSAVVRYSFR
jgi:hypothetical protein